MHLVAAGWGRSALFHYRTASRDEIEARAMALEGESIGALSTDSALDELSSPKTKGLVGRTIESYFGIPPNSRPEADFPGAQIELKTVPILLRRGDVRAKERISLGMINPAGLAVETWQTATVRHKLGSLLIVFYEWAEDRPIRSFRVLRTGIWQPSAATLDAVRADWEWIHGLAAQGRAGEMSESHTRILGAATKGPGSGARRTRAFSLKQSFVRAIYDEMTAGGRPASTGPLAPRDEFESGTLALLHGYVTWPVRRLAVELGLSVSGGKAGAAGVIRSLLGQPAHGRAGDFDTYGVEVKTVPISSVGRPVEAMSFPAFSHQELIFEAWETSDLLGRLNRLLIVPLIRDKGSGPLDATLGRAFFWSPPEHDLEAIASEWETYRRLVEWGEADRLPTASETRYIHVRPKARNASDRDSAPGHLSVTKKSFWLNQDYVGEVVTGSNPGWRGY